MSRFVTADKIESVTAHEVINRYRKEGEFMQEIKTENVTVPVSEKYMLTIREASVYFNIGIKKMRRLAEDNAGRFAVFSGNRYLIIRTKFEKFVEECSAI